MSVLIISQPSDVHAHAVIHALSLQGVDAALFSESDFPQKVMGTYDSRDDAFLLGGALDSSGVRTVWNRRRMPPVLHPSLHAADRRLAASIGSGFLRSWFDCFDEAVWVNAPEAAERGERKAVQLSAALKAGLLVPPTLISNDQARIRRFLEENAPAIVKPITIMSWDTGEVWIGMTTTRVTPDDIWDSVAVEACPMIYQREVAKDCEYRVIVCGEEMVCVEIDSQGTEGAELDWRDVKHRALRTRHVEVPAEIVEPIRRFMDALGLVHGSFDFIRGRDGRCYFLEINQQGQFLWLEECVPDLGLLSLMTEFLAEGGQRSFRSAGRAPALRYNDYVDSGRALQDIDAAVDRHVADLAPRIIKEVDYV